MKIKDLLTDKSKWTQYTEARDKNNNPIYASNKEATKFCLLGAIKRCYYGDFLYPGSMIEMLSVKRRIALEIGTTRIDYYNDDPKRTFKDIRNLIEKLDI